MATLEALKPGVHVKGLLPGKLVTLIEVKPYGATVVEVTYKDASGLPGTMLLYQQDAARLEIASHDLPWSFDADGALFRLVSEAYRISLAYLFDPLIAVHTSLIEPLPHQITAVYETMLTKQPLRYLLADDPGAGKTIMTGLLLKELMIRGDAHRCLIVAPGNLVEQWQDELSRKFHLAFDILTNDRLEASVSGNAFQEMPLCIARLDKLSRDERARALLEQTAWDLVVVDEAHKMSATIFGSDIKRTKRYQLGQLLGRVTRHLLLLTATPHNGKEEDFQLFLALLDQDRFESRFRGGVQKVDATDLMRHLVKEQLYKFDGRPLFPERLASTINYEDLHRFVSWLTQAHPDIETLAGVTRDHITAYAEALTTMISPRTGRPLATLTRRGALSCLSVFFQDTARWQWEDGPQRPLLQSGDLPKVPERVPRYIPEHELARLMQAIRALSCPYQRAALLIARWSGARRDEIVRLSIDCLDSYPDGTPRLRLPTGKTYQERMVPIHREAAEAIRVLQAQRKGERGLRDPKTGVMTRYLFMQHGKVLSASYLFTSALQTTCSAAGLLTAEGKPTVTAHRFRHTVGTQLARRQARMRTIMNILGHASAAMTMRYLDITDEEVLADYQAALEPGAPIAGPAAEILHAGTLSASDLDWLKCNFFKTELELGHCLRLPEEGPCECDLYLFCAKFLTTRQKAPRLRHRRKVELFLAEDAAAHGWMAEVGRHQRFARRCEELLADLGEPLGGPEAED